MRPERFQNRRHAGRVLATALSGYAGRGDVTVLALPRGGVPVGFEIAVALGAPLDVFAVRKLGVPGQEELAMGALASGGVMVVDQSVVRALGISQGTLDTVAAVEREELARRERTYRGGYPPLEVTDRLVVLADDGLATGTTMRAAIAGMRQLRPRELVVAVPVATPSVCDELAGWVDHMVCAATPEHLYAVGLWYADFSQTSDQEVRDLLAEAARRIGLHESPAAPM
jgi:predicted phosphoribosyltransferase